MVVFHVFKIVQMIPNRVKLTILRALSETEFFREFCETFAAGNFWKITCCHFWGLLDKKKFQLDYLVSQAV